jgi:hypothetical protein
MQAVRLKQFIPRARFAGGPDLGFRPVIAQSRRPFVPYKLNRAIRLMERIDDALVT